MMRCSKLNDVDWCGARLVCKVNLSRAMQATAGLIHKLLKVTGR